jgi:hypothetical protein
MTDNQLFELAQLLARAADKDRPVAPVLKLVPRTDPPPVLAPSSPIASVA